MLHYHYRLITASPDWSTPPCVKLAISRTSGANLRGDVSRKRFSTHVVDEIVARIGDCGCGNDKGMERAEGE